jgi:hypothetical protein
MTKVTSASLSGSALDGDSGATAELPDDLPSILADDTDEKSVRVSLRKSSGVHYF